MIEIQSGCKKKPFSVKTAKQLNRLAREVVLSSLLKTPAG